VNDIVDDIIGDDDDPRQEVGDELVSSNSKWHKHTVKVFSLLKRSMAESEDGSKPDQLSYNGMSKGSSRRTAAGVFFELLQLKTWDFIELDQDESYGDIKVRSFVCCGCSSLLLVDSRSNFSLCRSPQVKGLWRIHRQTRGRCISNKSLTLTELTVPSPYCRRLKFVSLPHPSGAYVSASSVV
jgi:hypothetical protein